MNGKKERGFILITVLIFLSILTVLVMIDFEHAVMQLKISHYQLKRVAKDD